MKKILLYLILIMAITMAGIVAYVSVGGLLQVFSGAGTLGLLFFTSIEVAKIVATSAMHTYSKRIGFVYKLLLSLGIGIAMLITSMGIYGFLSSTYKETFMKLESVEAQVSLLKKQRDGYQSQLDNVNKEKESINTRISELSNGLSNNVIQYKDPETGQIITTTSSSTRRTLEKQLNSAIERLDNISLKSDELNNKVFELDNQITEVKLGNNTAAELGPLMYLAEVTGKSMDDVMKYFIFLLIIIGDPMAVLMVIVFNKIVNKESDPEQPEPEQPEPEQPEPEQPEPEQPEPEQPEPEQPEQEEIVKPVHDDWLSKVKNPHITYIEPTTTNKDITSPEPVETIINEPTTVPEPETREATTVPEPKKKEELIDTKKTSETKNTETVKRKITIDDIPEKRQERERGFSVSVPNRKKTHKVDRVGSNK
jgi:TolA-binding protein